MKSFRIFLLAAMVIPTKTLAGWQLEKFNHIKPNLVSAGHTGLIIKVRSSASPLIYRLSKTITVSGFNVAGEFKGLPNFSNVSKQGLKGYDDYALRVGFVVPGSRRLSGIKKFFAATWVKRLYSELPPGAGLDHVQFFDVTQDPKQIGEKRVSPSSDLIHELSFAEVDKPGAFHFSYKLSRPIRAAAIWISADGDDTKSNYSVKLSQLKIYDIIRHKRIF